MSRFLLKSCVTLLLVVGFVGMSRAQDDEKIIRPNTKANSAAWMFEITGLGSFGMTGFNIPNTASGSGVIGAGWKWYFSDDMAVRALLGFTHNSSGADTLATGANSNTAFGIAAGVEMHTHPVYSTSPYFGAQVSFGMGSSDNTKKNQNEVKTSTSSFGIGVLAGFDWYFTHGIAIGGEYMLGFSTASSSTKTIPPSGSTITVDDPSTTNIGISSANVHLVVHF